MSFDIQFALSYTGSNADEHEIDLYDVAYALVGFQRSLALTTHLVLNGEIITQSPSLKGAQIYALPPEDGSWVIKAGVVVSAVYALGTAPSNTPLGHLVHSVYDYVVSESLGFHVDYGKSLGQLFDEQKEKTKSDVPKLRESQVDSLIEKCSFALKEIHRPIYGSSNSAVGASITSTYSGRSKPLRAQFSMDTYNFIRETYVSKRPEVIEGRISSYNSNTFKGRIFVKAEGRPVAFELAENARNDRAVRLITNSLGVSALRDYENSQCTVYCRAFRNTSKAGHLKSFNIVEVSGRKLI